jgi:hypothetical protein
MSPNLSSALTASLVSLVFLAVFMLILAGAWWFLIGHARPSTRKAKPANVILSPSGGVILSLAVQPGDRVAFGQELCRFEKQGLNQIIRAARPGEIGSVNIIAGDQIVRGQVIIEYRTPPKADPVEPGESVH